MATAATPASTLAPPARSRTTTVLQVIALSLAMTALAGCVAALTFQLFDVRFLWLFVVLRWIVFALLLTAPIAARAIPALPVPQLLRTPLGALAIMCESIMIDIISAQLH